MNFVVESESELVEKVWNVLRSKARAGFCVGLVGDLGAGKTTLVKGVAKILGVKETVSSPTFTISKRYKTEDENSPILQHIDLYRLEGTKSHDIAEITDMVLDPEVLTFVEWPEKVESIADRVQTFVKILPKGGNTREVEVYENQD